MNSQAGKCFFALYFLLYKVTELEQGGVMIFPGLREMIEALLWVSAI
ncbi:hypothetical protein IQ267_16780 [filamentous cyanobacterium LEGE 07170]|nr:hypothetical protein [filamentous cyanobacterium LEGE 07170]